MRVEIEADGSLSPLCMIELPSLREDLSGKIGLVENGVQLKTRHATTEVLQGYVADRN